MSKGCLTPNSWLCRTVLRQTGTPTTRVLVHTRHDRALGFRDIYTHVLSSGGIRCRLPRMRQSSPPHFGGVADFQKRRTKAKSISHHPGRWDWNDVSIARASHSHSPWTTGNGNRQMEGKRDGNIGNRSRFRSYQG